MVSAEQPTDSNADQDGSIGLLVDRLAQEPFERTCRLGHRIAGGVGDVRGTCARLPIDVPCCPVDFLGNAFRPLLRIVQGAIQITGTGSVVRHAYGTLVPSNRRRETPRRRENARDVDRLPALAESGRLMLTVSSPGHVLIVSSPDMTASRPRPVRRIFVRVPTQSIQRAVDIFAPRW
jgi:hypothetical protein